MIVTLAGHVDHGKTSLVQALTGVNTDRLIEEQQRGLTIDLGFAYIDHGAIGFVDVPGHHKFIHNMVAGVARQQFALLVIAADDGPMPQSREHLDILRLIGIERGAIAMTKCDRVNADRIEQCHAQIQDLTRGSFLETAPILQTSTTQAESFAPLLEELRRVAQTYDPTSDQAPFRLAVDRVFTVRGAGLVVTGTVHNGAVRENDTLVHHPSGKKVRVRSLRRQNQPTDTAYTGDRCAVNITGLDQVEIERGHWLLQRATSGVREFTLQLDVLPDFPRAVRHWTPVHVYHATSHATARIALLSNAPISPGSPATLVDVVCDDRLAVAHGDRIVIRDHSLDVTLGGGRVVQANPQPVHRRRSPSRHAEHLAYLEPTVDACCAGLLKLGYFSVPAFSETWQLTADALQDLLERHQALLISENAVSKQHLAHLAREATAAVQEATDKDSSFTGLKENAFVDIPAAFRTEVLTALVQNNRLQYAGGLYTLPGHRADLPERLAARWQRLEPALDLAQAPSTGDLAKQWRVPQAELEADMKELTRRGLLVHVAKHRFYLPGQLEKLATTASELAAEGPFNVRGFGDATGVGRNIAIEVLEYFDARGFTRRQGNTRILMKTHL